MTTGMRVLRTLHGWRACVATGAGVFLIALGLTTSITAETGAPQAAAPQHAGQIHIRRVDGLAADLLRPFDARRRRADHVQFHYDFLSS